MIVAALHLTLLAAPSVVAPCPGLVDVEAGARIVQGAELDDVDDALAAAHARFKEALAAGDDARIGASAAALESALVERSETIRTYAGL